jgi:DNA sulfur modification protein DndD
MLHFTKMTLVNFGPYKGEQTIDFTDQSGVTIFWGNNGRGKTTLLNAFRFGLFGTIQRRSGVLRHMREMENAEAVQEGRYGYEVIIQMTNDEDLYKLSRSYALRSGVTTPVGDEDYERTVFLSKNGSVLSPDQREHELNVIMPEQVSRFFLFDAELLQEYEELLEVRNAEGDEIKKAIEKILGMPVLKNGVTDIKECRNQYERRKTRAATADNKTVQLGQELESLIANIQEHQNIIIDKENQRAEMVRNRTSIEARMKETEQLRKWINNRNEAESRLKEDQQELDNVEGRIRSLTKDAWKGMLLSTIDRMTEDLRTEQSQLEGKKQKQKIADRFIMEMRRAVADQVCPVCGQEISTEITQNLQKKINGSGDEFAGLTERERIQLDEVNEALINAKRLTEDVHDLKGQIKLLEDQQEKLIVNIRTYRSDIAEYKEDITRYSNDEGEDDVLSLTKKHSKIERDIDLLATGIQKEKEELEKLKKRKQTVSDTLDRNSGGMDYRLAQRQYEMCDLLYKIFDESKSQYREQLKKNVEKDASNLFRQLSADKDYVGLKINDNYGLEIVHRSGRTVPGRSSGYEHIVALSLIGALHKNAPLQGPIIIDSPFGRLDPENKENIVSTLPSMAEQVILLAYNGEIAPEVARRKLGGNLNHEHNLERITSMHTEIM